jgi:predicted PurR-regulated permease PerM
MHMSPATFVLSVILGLALWGALGSAIALLKAHLRVRQLERWQAKLEEAQEQQKRSSK